ncbi:diacylglycerol lipase-beta-like isoform X2 [Zingiber officinale]|uniref:diacylglycerol lipase-beta-like isoform X2 n=1 Tax=Zingiber officinale TaxID=94328 RepID=UPI001C4CAF6B|nr:diacylglycerol lipase-beta-like isoform X2 [Zingiber officinale]
MRSTDSGIRSMRKEESYLQYVAGVINRCLSQHPKVEREDKVFSSNLSKAETSPVIRDEKLHEPHIYDNGSDQSDNFAGWKQKLEVAWLSKALEPAMQLYKWASLAGSDEKHNAPSSSRSLSEIFTSIQKSKIGIQDWSFSDLTVGLYLIYISQASTKKAEEFEGVQIFSDSIVQDLIYYLELAKGAYKDNATVLSRISMLQERNILKFIKDSSLLRPGYYIGIDRRNKLVIFGIRGTHNIYDLITDIITSSNNEVSFEGFTTHFGTAEAARWFLHHELKTIRKCLEKHKGYKLRLVGHSLGGAAAALFAVILRKQSADKLGFDPDIVSAVGFATPPCVSKELAESCASYVTTVVLQDDVIPRLSVVALAKLRNQILETDWMSVLGKEDWKGMFDLVANAKQVVSSVQDAARKLTSYTKFRDASIVFEAKQHKDSATSTKPDTDSLSITKLEEQLPEELYVPGTIYYLKRGINNIDGHKSGESYSLWKRNPDQDFRSIAISGKFISDHRCDSHYYALREVLKSLPISEGGRTVSDLRDLKT